MRVIDMSKMDVVHFGREWPYADLDPSSKGCITELERNEGLVTWLQPVGGGLEDQIPSIRVGDKFCALSLRMQKSLFRHVRLKKDFVNREALSNGYYKLRIPLLLMQEKVRTQTRFNVMRSKDRAADPCQRQRPCHGTPPVNAGQKERRGISSMSKHINSVIKERILPMAGQAFHRPEYTPFCFTEHDALTTIITDIVMRDCPTLTQRKEDFLAAVSAAYDEAQTGVNAQ